MVQEFNVLKCYKCQVFQVHIVKKANKWECKMCGARQSFVQNYGCGTAKECRLHVQNLNKLRLINDVVQINENLSVENRNNSVETSDQTVSNSSAINSNKWAKYLDEDDCEENQEDSAESEGVTYVLELPKNNRKRKFEKSGEIVCVSDELENECNIVKNEQMVTKNEEIPYASLTDRIPKVEKPDKTVNSFRNTQLNHNKKGSVPNKWSKYVDENDNDDST